MLQNLYNDYFLIEFTFNIEILRLSHKIRTFMNLSLEVQVIFLLLGTKDVH
jgi:hypothetical protein